MEFEINLFFDSVDTGVVLLDKKGVVKEKNSYYLANYEILEFNRKKESFFDNTILSSEQKSRLARDGKVSVEVIWVAKSNSLIKIFPKKRLIDNKFLKLSFIALKSGEDIAGYTVIISDNTDTFNNNINIKEAEERWKNISVLGKQAYFSFELNTSKWSFSESMERLTGTKNDIYAYLNILTKADKNMLMEQWGLSLTDSIQGDIFEYTFKVNSGADARYHSARWTLDSSDPANPIVYGLVMDITELSKTESALGESLSMVSLLSGQEDIILWSYDIDEDVFTINKSVSSEKFSEEVGLTGVKYTLSEIVARVGAADVLTARKEFAKLSAGEISTINLKTDVKNQKDNCIFVSTNFVIQKTDIKGSPILLMGLSKQVDSHERDGEIPKKAKTMEETKKTILIAEDIDNNFDLLNIILRKDYKLVRAINGVEAVKLYSEVKPDLILMDMKMPEMGGLEATKLIRMESQDVPVIAVTAFAFESDREVALEAGCNDFLSKPIDIPVLKNLIRQYLG